MPPKAKNLLLLLLTATTVTTGVIAWQQTQRLAALQDQLSKASSATAAVKPRRSAPLAVPPPAVTEAPRPPAAEAPAPADAPAAPNALRAGGNRPDFAALMENPEFAQAMNLHQRAGLDSRYADLFKKLQLAPAELEKLKMLLVERQASRVDVMNSARAQGLDPRANRDEINKLTVQAQAEVDASIKSALGEAVYNQFQNYETSQPQRGLISQLDQRLSYTATPLNATQAEFLVKALTASSASNASAALSDAVIQQAQSVLTPNQVDALKQLQAEQKAQQKVRDLMRPPTKTAPAR